MSKYEPLEQFLRRHKESEIRLKFKEIEDIIGDRLPPSARRHRAWWSNNPSNSVITHAWLDAGFVSEQVNMSGEELVFRRPVASAPASPTVETVEESPHPLFGALKGTMRVTPGTDLTAPLWPAEG